MEIVKGFAATEQFKVIFIIILINPGEVSPINLKNKTQTHTVR